jgi:hypothetical protein
MTTVCVHLVLTVAMLGPTAQEKAPDRAADVKRQAERTAKAVRDGDYETLVKMTYPGVVAAMGGREQMIAKTSKAMTEMKDQGFRILTYTVEAPSSFVTEGRTTFTVVPTAIEMTAPGGKLVVKSYLIGVSADDGAHWTFVDGSGKAEVRKKLLPHMPAALKLPEPQQPSYIKTP